MNIAAPHIDNIIRREGGYTEVDQPTKYGIILPTLRAYRTKNKVVYPERDLVRLGANALRDLTITEARAIHEHLFYEHKVHHIEDFKLRDIYFDSCINHGEKPAVEWLQWASGVKVDGIFGPITRKAANTNKKVRYYNFLKNRVLFYAIIAITNPYNRPYLMGWLHRVSEYITDIEDEETES